MDRRTFMKALAASVALVPVCFKEGAGFVAAPKPELFRSPPYKMILRDEVHLWPGQYESARERLMVDWRTLKEAENARGMSLDVQKDVI